MQIMQAFKYELQPDGEQERDMRRISGACRFVFNKALALQKENHGAGNKFIGYVAMAKQLTEWRNSTETPWLKQAPCHPLQHALKDLDRAYKNFFSKRADFPRFKRKGADTGFRYPDPMQIKLDQANSRIFLPKLGWIRYRKSREIVGELRNVTVTHNGKKWFISIQTEREADLPKRIATTAIGIDVGIARFATLSDSNSIMPLNSFKKHQERLRCYQRGMARKVKFSNNWKNATFNTASGFVNGLKKSKLEEMIVILPSVKSFSENKLSQYKFNIESSDKVILTKGGYLQLGIKKNLAVLKGVGILGCGLNVGGVVEPHWHTNAGELVYIVKGKTKITVLAPDGHVEILDVNGGEGAFAPASHFHNIENVGQEEVEVIAFFSHEEPDYIGIGEVTGSFSNEELGALFEVAPSYFNAFKKPQGPLVIVPQ